ncbi:MAG: hypothetical protein JW888_10210 [Pirellulales bacterium]|nr:hypothetical protein [Pirellulales bacterium]
MTHKDAPAGRRPSPDEARRNVERLVQRNRQSCDAILRAAHRPPVVSVGIVGAGMMGRAIAAASLAGGIRIVLHDAESSEREDAPGRIFAELITAIGLPSPEADALVDHQLDVAASLDAVAACPLTIESVPESAAAKRRVFADLEPLLTDDAVLATNTSTIPVDQLAAGLRRPERFCGIHFFHPVAQRPLVEVVRGTKTSPATVAAAVGYARSIDKMALPVGDGPGFIVNRLLLPYLTEAVELLLDGASIERVESVATAFGMAKGPLELLDEIGLDTAIAGGRVLWEAFPRRLVVSPLMIAMYKAGRFGVKSGAGFFNHAAVASKTRKAVPEPGDSRASSPPKTDGAGETSSTRTPATRGRPPVDPVALEKTAQWARTPLALADDDVLDRLLLPMVLEATRLLDEGRAADPRDIDLGVLFGLGFPASQGGLLFWADAQGQADLMARLSRLASLGPRAEPTALLREMTAAGRRFYE